MWVLEAPGTNLTGLLFTPSKFFGCLLKTPPCVSHGGHPPFWGPKPCVFQKVVKSLLKVNGIVEKRNPGKSNLPVSGPPTTVFKLRFG